MRAAALGMVLLCGLAQGAEPRTVTNTIGMELIELPAGKFTMGEGGGAVAVTLTKPFWLGKTEVTQGQWQQVMGGESAQGKDAKDVPVYAVDWDAATAFCHKLTALEHKAEKLKSGESYRLPTEAQWEYACRADTTTAYSFGDAQSRLSDFAWFYDNARDSQTAYMVGFKQPNPWGLYDMHGNVEEWCSDWYDNKLPGGTDPVGPSGGSYRVIRGGAFRRNPGDCRSAFRSCNVPSSRYRILGFRVALEAAIGFEPTPVAGVDLLAVPSEAEVAEAVILIREAYADDYKDEPDVLIKTLKSAAGQTEDAVRKFALLQEGEKAAAWAGDPSQAFELLEKRGSLFKIDVQQSSITLIKKFTKSTGETTKKLVERLLQLSRTAFEADQFPFAKEAVELGVVHARALVAEERAKNVEGDGLDFWLNEVLALQKDITQRSELFDDYKKALATLQKAGAGACGREHTVVGRYRCLASDDWETGLAFLAKGEAGPLRVAASKELVQKSGEKQVPKELLAVAGEWWKLSEKPEKPKPPEDEATEKPPVEGQSSLSESDVAKLREHSGALYREALLHLVDPIDRALAEKRAVPDKKITNSIGIELVSIPKGKFMMGEGGGAVAVILTKTFLLGKYEVTQGQFKKVMGTEPWLNQECVQIGEDNAASYVSWNDATAFCQRLTDTDHKSGKLPAGESYRLPTDAEWEYACRAGTTTAYSFGEDASKLGEYAWFKFHENDPEPPAYKVGLKKPNPWGLHDMHGNVVEWCSDCFVVALPGGTDPLGPAAGSGRVCRGGWRHFPALCRSAFRYSRDPSFRYNSLGFRVARSQSAQKQ